MRREDHYIGPLHLIIRRYSGSPQYGFLLWGGDTLDIWIHRTLITLRRSTG